MIQNLTKQNLYPPTSEVSREVENLIESLLLTINKEV